MSHHDIPEIRDIFRDYNIETIDIKYSANNTKRTQEKVHELLIMNF